MARKLLTLLLLLAGASAILPAQNYLMDGNPVTACNGTFFDSGGGSMPYGNNQNLSTTICSDGSGGTHIRLDFSGVDLAPGDVLCFYDGATTAAPLLSCSNDYTPGQPFVVQATAVNPSGCLTVSFQSDGSGTGNGWAASISCQPSCQQVLAELVSTNPAAVPADTGWIDVCPGERIFFTGQGIYPQNGFAYNQSDLTTEFEWSFGDGGIAYGPAVSHRYDEPGGYFVQLFLTDVAGCRSTNLINQRIRVAPRPDFTLAGDYPNSICAGDTLHLSAAIDSANGQTLLVTPNTESFASGGSRSDSLALPDGTGVPYQTSLLFTEFSPGQTLTNVDDLLSICANMEHSWMRDLEISLTCPNGQSIILHNFGGQTGSQVYLGVPNDNDGFNPVPGSGYDYCWTPNASNGTWLQFANANLGLGGTLPAGDYSTFDPMTDLLGCPLNGEWTLTVLDLWAIDNGYIFSWGIDFNPALYPALEQFTPELISWTWQNHPSIYYSSADSISATPQNAGTAGYTFTVTDSFGCTWDSLLNIAVLPPTHPQCYSCQDTYLMPPDTALCSGGSVQLDASYNGPLSGEVRFEAFPDYPLGNGNHPHNNPFLSPIAVNSVGFPTITNAAAQITSVCIDIETDFDADLNIFLRSPDGKQLELSTGNGGSGDNYKITCFSPAAVTPIVGSTAPFNGTYMPEGSWTNLNGAVANGDWQLVVSDGFGINQLGKVRWWSIGFNIVHSVNYSWSNASSLSCSNCPDPVATPQNTETYILTAIDAYQCLYRDTIQIDLLNFFPAPSGLAALIQGNGVMTWSWDPVPGASGYEVNINGAGWIPSNGGASHTLSGLQSGQQITIEVRVAGAPASCPPAIASASQVYFNCTLVAAVDSLAPAPCAGQTGGSAWISAGANQGPLMFFPDGQVPGQSNGNFVSFFSPGNHFVVAVDSAGCRDTVDFIIDAPAVLLVDAIGSPAACNGDNSGSVAASGNGGTLPYAFTWQACSGGILLTGPNQSDLFPGCYSVTLSDANGCTAIDTAMIDEPPPFQFSGVQDSVSCFGGSDGGAAITVGGGLPPYQYTWDNGDTTNTASNLDAGFHGITVTDANGCQAVTLVQVLQPPALSIDSISVWAVQCAGSANGQACAWISGGTGPYTYAWSSGNSSGNCTNGLPAGLYAVTITDAKACSAVGQFTIGSPAPVLLTLAQSSGETCSGACDGSAAVLAAGGNGGYQLQWSDPDVVPNATSADGLCPGNYTVTLTDAQGCADTLAFTISSGTEIMVQIQETPANCAGQLNGFLEAIANGGIPPLTYSWNSGQSGGTLPGPDCNLNYSVTVTDAQGCSADAEISDLYCPPEIHLTLDTLVPVRCFGENNGQIGVSVSGGTGMLSLLWNDPNAQTLPLAVQLVPGAYTVTATDTNGCTASLSASISEPPVLTGTISAINARCFGESSGALVAQPLGGTPPYAFAWSVPGSGPQLTSLPAGSYQLTLSDANGCQSGPISAIIGQPATPLSVLVEDVLQPCYGTANGSATLIATGSNGSPYTFQWSTGQTGSSAGGLAAGFYRVTTSDSEGCTRVDTFTLAQLDSIRMELIFSQPSCNGQADGSAAVNAISGGAGSGIPGNYSYLWSVPGSGTAFFQENLVGGQTYTVTATDNRGCTGQQDFFLPQPPPLRYVLTVSPVRCFGNTDGGIRLDSIGPGQNLVSYLWSTGAQTPSVQNLPAGWYTLTVTDGSGCTRTDSVEILQPPALDLDFVVKPLGCYKDNSGAVLAVPSGGTPEYSFVWSTGANGALITQLAAGVYQATVQDQNACTYTDTVMVQEPPPLDIQITTQAVSCFGAADGKLEIRVLSGQAPYRYSLDSLQFGGSAVWIGLRPGDYKVWVKDAGGCVSAATTNLSEPPPVTVTLGPDTILQFGAALELLPEVSNAFAPLRFHWSSNLVDSITCLDPPECSMVAVQPVLSNRYQVTVTDANGCTATARIRVEVEKQRGIFVPTGFTPNQDFVNDVLVVYGKSEMVREINRFRIYDRWGELVYEDRDFKVNAADRGWDGRFRGAECPAGVYVWYIEATYQDGFQDALHGNTTLIR